MDRLLIVLAVWVMLGSGAAAAATVSAEHDCGGFFPDVGWEVGDPVGKTRLLTAGEASRVSGRYATDAEDATRAMEGTLDLPAEITVCVFGGDVELDGAGLVGEFQRLHGVLWADEAVVAIDAQQPKLVRRGIVYAIAQIALWETATNLGLDGYPQPLGEAIAQWYVASLTDRVDTHRATMRRALFIGDPQTDDPATPWTTGDGQAPILVWNPEFQESPIGDVVRFAVETRGSAVLRSPTPTTWDPIDLDWRQTLRVELLGDEEGAVDWRWGFAIVVAVVGAALLVAYLKRRERRRFRYQPGERAPLPGLFDE